MAHEILSVKMYELDKKLEQTHSRIQLAESMDTERLHQQIQNLLTGMSGKPYHFGKQTSPFQDRLCNEAGRRLRPGGGSSWKSAGGRKHKIEK